MGVDFYNTLSQDHIQRSARKSDAWEPVATPHGERSRTASNPKTIQLMRLPSNSSSSSGSECEPDSICLAEMVNEFLEDGFGDPKDSKANSASTRRPYSSTKDELDADCFHPIHSLEGLTKFSDPVEKRLAHEVSSIVDSRAITSPSTSICDSGVEKCSLSCLRRFVVDRLHTIGYNAAVCKSRWSHTRNSPGGEHEYIDVIVEGTGQRLIVDIDFAGQFQITRPTPQYLSVLQTIPSIFVGRTSRLVRIVDIMTEEAKVSLKSRDMHLPPWRKLEYMRLKWLSQHKRIAITKGDQHRCSKPDVVVSQIGNKGTETSPILLEVQTLNDDPLHYGGKVFCLKEKCLRGARTDCECSRDGSGMSRKEGPVSVFDNLQWKLPSVDSSAPKVRAGLSACLKQSELAKQLKKGTPKAAVQ